MALKIAMMILQFVKSNWKSILLISMVTIFFTTYYGNKLDRLNIELNETKDNYEAYKGILEGKVSDNKVIHLNKGELNHTKDTLVEAVNNFVTKNKEIKPDISSGVTQIIRDTILIPINKSIPEFDVTKELNEETKITVIGRDSNLTLIPDISNTVLLEVGVKREYKNHYKSGWSRFWHFDWKKVNSLEYRLDNTNKLIKLNNVRVIKHEN